MNEQLISFPIAKLAKEKGFNLLCMAYYGFDDSEEEWIPLGENSPSFINNRENHFAAPTQSLLQKWLREKHKIHVTIVPYKLSDGFVRYFILKTRLTPDLSELFDTYEAALEYGLFEALKLI